MTELEMELRKMFYGVAEVAPAPVKPSREDVARVLHLFTRRGLGHEYRDIPACIAALTNTGGSCLSFTHRAADAVLALLPGRSVAEVKAEALEGMSEWFQIASRLGGGEPDALAAQACADAAARLRGESNV